MLGDTDIGQGHEKRGQVTKKDWARSWVSRRTLPIGFMALPIVVMTFPNGFSILNT